MVAMAVNEQLQGSNVAGPWHPVVAALIQEKMKSPKSSEVARIIEGLHDRAQQGKTVTVTMMNR